jgi:FkbM family methyltransferase
MADAGEDVAQAFARLHGLIDRLPSADELVQALDTAAGARPGKRRGQQAELLAQLFRLTAETAHRCGWTGKVVISGGRVLIDQDGALFPAEVSNRYFRGDGASPGAAILAGLQDLRIEPRTILDVGANIGELSIYFARQLPDCRVIAFEPAPENLEGFRANLALQDPPLGNLEVVAEAVSDRSGKIAFSIGAGLLNTAMLEANRERIGAIAGVSEVEVPADTLEGHCARLGADRIDLVKIDIEGGEPLLAGAIAGMKGRIGAAFVEISVFNSLEAYGRLIEAFGQAGLVMAGKDLRRIPAPLEWLGPRLAQGPARNVWFIDPDRARPPRSPG